MLAMTTIWGPPRGGPVPRRGAPVLLASVTAAVLAASVHGALAQTSLNPSTRVSTPLGQGQFGEKSSVPALPQPEALFPNIFGAGPWLRDHGIAVLLDNTNEFSGAFAGGSDQGASNAGQYALETDIDWQKLAGLTGFSTHTVVVGRYGIPSSRIFGDNLNPSSEIYGSGGNVVVHLVYAYGEETLAQGRVDLTAGRIPFLNDFSSSPLYCNFMNNAFCGNPKDSSDNFSHSSYPDSSWAVRLRVRPTQATYIQSGIFFSDANIYQATNGYRSGFRFNAQQVSGEAFPVELGWEPLFGPDKLPGHYKLGFSYDSNDHPDDYYDRNGVPYAISGLDPRQNKGATSEWAEFDQMVLRHGSGATDGLILFGGYYHNDPQTATREDEYEIAAIDHGFWKARPMDGIGAAFSYTTVSGTLIKQEELQQELGLPITGTGTTFYDASQPGIQSSTMTIEATYQIHVFRGITFAPDFQYFIRPNAQRNLPDAALLGFKSHIELF